MKVERKVWKYPIDNGTNIVVIVSEFDVRSFPTITALLRLVGSLEHYIVYVDQKELKLLNFQLSSTTNPSLGSNGSLSKTGRFRGDSLEPLLDKNYLTRILLKASLL